MFFSGVWTDRECGRTRERKTWLTAQWWRTSPRSRSVSTTLTHPVNIDLLLTVGIDLLRHGLLKHRLPVHQRSSLFNLYSPAVSPECYPAAAVGSVPLDDGPGPGSDGGYGNSQTLCLQPAGGRSHSGTTELALPQGHVWNPRYWCAGEQRNGKPGCTFAIMTLFCCQNNCFK